MHITDGELIRRNSSYRIYQDTLNGFDRSLERIGTQIQVDSISPKMGWSVNAWSGFSYSQPTWCNVYAMDLSYKVYGLIGGDSPVPYGGGNNTANKLNEIFKDSLRVYKDLKKAQIPVEYDNVQSFIWGEYVNKGFPVYFSGTGNIGHIETAFPFYTGVTKTNKTYFNAQDGYSFLDSNSMFISIGGGTYTGFASYNEFSFLKNAATGAYVFLGYLKKEY